MAQAPDLTLALPTLLGVPGGAVPRPRSGARIANSRGIPGTLGCLAHTLHDRRPVLLSNWHVLFGNGGEEDGVVWLVDEVDGTRRLSAIGNVLYGKLGTVRLDGESYYVDCAVSSCPPPPGTPSPLVSGHDIAQPGDLVTKTGAMTGTTTGIVVSVDYSDVAWIEGRSYPTPRQLLVRRVDSEAPFSAEGDSGALIVNAMGKAVGLLWGANSRGEGVACPIDPVLHAMNITLWQATYED